MKKFIILLVAAAAIVSCQKNPDMDELSSEYLVYTSYDPAQFPTPSYAEGQGVFVPDVIAMLNDDGTTTPWNTGSADNIIEAYKSGLEAYGYDTEAYTSLEEAQADNGLQLVLVYIRDIDYYYTYYSDYWWWDWYWPTWYYPYPYPVVYASASATMTAELALANAPEPSEGDEPVLPVKWNSLINGYDFGSQESNAPFILDRIPQAFTQSPYLQTQNPI